MTEADREGELSFRQTIGNLPLILSDKEILLRELTEKFFPFNLPEKSPRVLPRTRIARIQKPDPTLPFGVQQIVKRANLLRLYLTRVIPKGLAGVTEKGIDVRFVLTLSSQMWPPHQFFGSFTSGRIMYD